MNPQLKKAFHDSFGKFFAHIADKYYAFKFRAQPNSDTEVKLKRPVYVSQLAGAKSKSISSFYGSITDLKAMSRFGATSLEEFSYWSWRSCAIATVKMVVETKNPSTNRTSMDYIRIGLKHAGYDIENDIGWYHRAIVAIFKDFGLNAVQHKFVGPYKMAQLIRKGSYLLASLDSPQGGHIVLVYGYRQDHGKLAGFYLHDPMEYTKKGEGVYKTIDQFNTISTRRIIEICR